MPGPTLVGDLVTLGKELAVTLVVTTLGANVENLGEWKSLNKSTKYKFESKSHFDLSVVLSTPAEETVSSQQHICVY